MSFSDAESTLLASKFTVRQYHDAVARKDRAAIAEAYADVLPSATSTPHLMGRNKHGFTQMAISCPMLEALESSMRGWKKSIRQSEKLFVDFLDREPDFATLRALGSDFFANVRCGILHQVETTAGWRIGRCGDLFDGDRTINADKFIRALQKVLNAYCDELKKINWATSDGTQPGGNSTTSATTAALDRRGWIRDDKSACKAEPGLGRIAVGECSKHQVWAQLLDRL
jgi:hypothetical protein